MIQKYKDWSSEYWDNNCEWLDNTGKSCNSLIPKSYYVPQGISQLLISQHWSQALKDYKNNQGTGSTTYANGYRIYWDQRKYELTIPLGQSINVANNTVSPGYIKFKV